MYSGTFSIATKHRCNNKCASMNSFPDKNGSNEHDSICRYLLNKNNIPWAVREYNKQAGRPVGEAAMKQWLESASTDSDFVFWVGSFGKSHRTYHYKFCCVFIQNRYSIDTLVSSWNKIAPNQIIGADTMKRWLSEPTNQCCLFVDWVLDVAREESGNLPERTKYKIGRWGSSFFSNNSTALIWCVVVFLFAYRLGISS